MLSNEDIKKLKGNLKLGDRIEIAEKSGFSKVTVNKFFSPAKHHELSEEAVHQILKATADVIRKHKQRKADNEKIIASI